MGQQVTRNGKTYYKADSGKLYPSYEAALIGTGQAREQLAPYEVGRRERVNQQAANMRSAAAGQPVNLREAKFGTQMPGGPGYGALLNGRDVLVQRGAAASGALAGGSINFAGQTLYPAKSGQDVIWQPRSGGAGRFAESDLSEMEYRYGIGSKPGKAPSVTDPAALSAVDTTKSDWTPAVTPRERAQAERMNELSQQAGGRDYSYKEAFPREYAAAESVRPVVEQYRTDLQSNPLADLPELIDQRSQTYGQRADITKWLETMQAGGTTQKKIAADFLAKQRPAPVPLSEGALFRPSESARETAEAGYNNMQIDPAVMEGASALPRDAYPEQTDAWWHSGYGVGDGTLQTPALPGSREEALGFSEPFLPANAMRELNLSGNEALNRVQPQQAAKTAADRDAAEAGYDGVDTNLLNQYLQRAQKLNAARFN